MEKSAEKKDLSPGNGEGNGVTNGNGTNDYGHKVIPQVIEDEMKRAYIDYAMSVIVGRALPDIRDGLKPVHRRILYAMSELGMRHNTPFKKSARIVGEVLGKFHPHGDQAVYDSLVRMVQDFSLRYPLVLGQGNFGCFTKDTKVRLADGRSLSFQELVDEDALGKRNYTFTVDEQGKIAIALIEKPRMTKRNAELVQVTLDNGQMLRCTPQHPFLLRNGEYKEARELMRGESLMPLYSRLSAKEDGLKPGLYGYELIFQPHTQQWILSHHLADEYNLANRAYTRSAGRVCEEHPELQKIKSVQLTRTLKLLNQNRIINGTGKKKFLRICKEVIEKEGFLTPELYERHRNEVYPYGHAPNWNKAFEKYYENQELFDVMDEACNNHQVVSVEALPDREDVFDLTIAGTHNFSLAAGVFVHNSIDGDNAAAMRYSEAKLSKIADDVLADLDKETVAFTDNFDGTLTEPTILPSKVPLLLVNGSAGIAVGMATNIPPHNIGEVARAIITLIDNPEITITELMHHIKGPDFPTGAIIQGKSGILHAYQTGRGKIRVVSVIETEEKKNRKLLVVKEIPYMINKSQLVEEIANAIRDKKIEGVSDLRDESNKEGIRIVMELKESANVDLTKNQLLQNSRCQDTFSIIFLSLVNNEPRVLPLKSMLIEFLEFRKDVIKKRTTFDLKRAEERAHIVDGLLICLKNIDAIVDLLKKAKDTDEAKKNLIAAYNLSDKQCQAILEMRLARLTGLEQSKLREEAETLKRAIQDLKDILASEKRIMDIIKGEMAQLEKDYGDKRRTAISDEEVDFDDFDEESLIAEEDQVITMSNQGYIKRMPMGTYKVQRRGGKGVIGATKEEADFIEQVFVANTHSFLLCFTNMGQVHWLKVHQIPEASRYSKGKAIVNLIELGKDEKITSIVPVKEFKDGHFLMMATKKGVIKKTEVSAYSHPRQGGIKAIILDEGDSLITVAMTDDSKNVILATRNGLAVRFKETAIRGVGRTARGVRGVRLKQGDYVIGMVIAADSETLLTMTENGFGKKSEVSDYRLVNRGGQGVKNIICSERNGKVVAVKAVTDLDELIVMSKNGIVLKVECKGISTVGRNAQGVRIMKLAEKDSVVSCEKIGGDAA